MSKSALFSYRLMLLASALLLSVVGAALLLNARARAAGPVAPQDAPSIPTAGGDLDLSFAPNNILQSGVVEAIAVQADGKIVIGGNFTAVNGAARGGIARLNADGTLDTSFGNGLIGVNRTVEAIAVQADGKIVIGGNFTTVNGVARGFIARLNADGTLDTSFGNGLAGANGIMYAVAVQAEGKVVMGGDFTTVNGVARGRIARLNADGTLDTSFGNGLAGANNSVNAVAVQADGKVVMGGAFTTVNGVARGRIARLNADGTLDTSFGNGLAGANDAVYAVAVQPDGKIVIGGDFITVNGVARGRIARLNTDGTPDTSFGNGLIGASGIVRAIVLQADGKIVIGGDFGSVNGGARGGIARLNADGTLDTSFGNGLAGTNGFSLVNAVAVQADGKIVIGGNFTTVNGGARGGIARLNADGTLDTSFSSALIGVNGTVYAVPVQADGKVVIGGDFTTVSGVARGGIARLNADGTLDTSFGNGLAGASSTVNAVAVQADGKVVIGGAFTTVNDVARGRIARLNADGTLDTSFGNGLAGANNSVNAVAVQADGKIVIGGNYFTTVNGVARGGIARLNADGTLDTSFGNGLAGASTAVYAIAVQADGKVVIGGAFITVNGVARGHIARLNADGTLDTSFGNGLAGASGTVRAVVLQADGKIVIGGSFTTVNGVARGFIARLNADGTLDTSFGNGLTGAGSTVYAVAVQADGKVVMGGTFTTVNGVARGFIARLNADGTLDTSFGNGLAGANLIVYAVAVQADGKVVLGGAFTTVNGVTRIGLARLFATTSLQFSALISSVTESASTALITVTRDGSGGPATVNFATANGSATGGASCGAGVDYVNASGTLTWADGDAANKTFNVPLCNDNLFEGNETVNLALSNATGATLGTPNTAVLTITDDETQPTLAVNDVSQAEGNSGAANFVFNITLSNPSAQTVTVQYATANGTATAGSDYTATAGTLTFNAGESAKQISVPVFGDTLNEPDETFFVNLTNPVNASLSRAQGLGTILNDDAAIFQFSSAVYSANEGAGVATLTVTRTGETSGAATVDYKTNDGFTFVECSANNGIANQRCDYTSTNGTLSFAAGETAKTFTVPVSDDQYQEGNETVNLSLSNPSGGIIGGSGAAALTVVDNDTTAPATRLFLARLNGTQEAPATNSAATGLGTVQLSADETNATVNLSFSNLSSSQTAAHVHGAAPVEVNAPILFNLGTGAITNFAIALTPAQAAQLKAGLFYFNVHTANFPNGEIRGQVLPNPLENARFFVRQQYADFLSREPDPAGWDYWTGQLTGVGTDLNGLAARRREVSNAFFFELEFQQTGAYVYRLYRAAYGNNQPLPNPETTTLPSYTAFVQDRARVVGGTQLAASQLALANAFGQRPEFVARYPVSQTGTQFVDALLNNIQQGSGANLQSQRDALIALFNSGGRGVVLYRLADDNAQTNPINNRAFIDAEYNRAFVATQYFGYLRRDPDAGGFTFWLSVVNQFPLRDVPGQLRMVCAFITAQEYQQRFGLYFTRANNECQ